MTKTKRCLIIDDDEDDQEIFVMCVQKISNDIECATANDGVEALIMLRSDPEYVPDYIFLDVNMPKMDGIDCLKELKKIRHLEHTRIFIYSTTSEGSAVNDSKEFGAEDYLVKPTNSAELKEKLYTILDVVSSINDESN